MRAAIALPMIVVALLISLSSAQCEANGFCGRHGDSRPAAHYRSGHIYAAPRPASIGYVAPQPKSAYAYGWFGVKPRCHKGVHHGYYNNYTQWSYR